MLIYTLILIAALCAGMLSGIIGTGSSIILLPLLVYQFGPKQAVPIMAIAGLMANVGKVVSWWREIDWRAFAAYAIQASRPSAETVSWSMSAGPRIAAGRRQVRPPSVEIAVRSPNPAASCAV